MIAGVGSPCWKTEVLLAFVFGTASKLLPTFNRRAEKQRKREKRKRSPEYQVQRKTEEVVEKITLWPGL